MKTTVEDAVRIAIARQLRVGAATIRDAQRLKGDLKLTLLDVVHVALDLEQRLGRDHDIDGDFPVAQLVGCDTVAELTELFRFWTEHAHRRTTA